MKKMVDEKMPPLPDAISEELRNFLVRCFEKDPFNRIDAKSLLDHQWLKKYDNKSFKRIISISDKLPEEVTNTIKMHID
jgi:serine/threonine protein kinase